MTLAVATLSLGLGIGATTVMYSLLSRVTHYELGFANQDRLVVLSSTSRDSGEQPPTYDIVQALLKSGQSFEAFGLHQPAAIPVTISGAGETRRVTQGPVNVDGLSIVGVAPILGRTYRLADFDDVVKQKEARAIVISYGTWQQQFDGAPDVTGRTLRVDGEPRTVIGVMPEGFRLSPWLDDIAFWAATDLRPIAYARWMTAIGRLKPGVSLEAAEAEATAVSRQVLQAQGQKVDGVGAHVVPLQQWMFGDTRQTLVFLLGTVSLVLLIGCANVANLLLASGAARQKEFALRAATGAGRTRLVRQLLTENFMLAFAGGLFGLLLALAGTRLFALIVPAEFPALIRHLSVDGPVLAFAIGVSTLSSLLFGLVPAVRASRVDLIEALKEGGRTAGSVRRGGRNVLLVAEVSLAMVLLVGAGLLLRGLIAEERRLPGFDPERLLTADILLAGPKYFSKTAHDTNIVTPQVEAFYDQLVERVRAMPGVTRAGVISRLPMQVWMHGFTILGRPEPADGHRLMADFTEVDPQALDTLGIRVVRGRGIEERDVAAAPWVTVINRSFADRYFPGHDPVGQAIRVWVGWGGQPGTIEEPQPRQIVGVAADVAYPRYFIDTPAVMYVPFHQHLNEYGSEDEWLHTGKTLVVRTAGDPTALVHPINDAVARIDRDQTATEFKTMKAQIAGSGSVANSRFLSSLFGVFSGFAVLLALMGVYGVVSWVVGQRTLEVGIRVAIGARPIQVARMLLLQSLWPVALGIVLGALGGIGLGRLLNSMFWNLTSPDLALLAALGGGMLIVAVAAAVTPVRRALRLDPQFLLRNE